MEEKKPGLQKALRVLSVVLLIGSVLAFLFVAFTFIMAFFVGGQIITDGTGLMRFFLKATAGGQRPIAAGRFAYAGMPALAAVVCFLLYCCVLISYLYKRKKHGAAFSGARGHLIALCVLSLLSIAVPLVLWALFQPIVTGSGFFALQMPNPIPGCLLLALTVLGTVLSGRAPQLPQSDEDDGGQPV